MQTTIDSVAADARISLLIIDDDPASRERLAVDLADARLEILTAATPEIGLDIASRRNPPIMLITPQPGAAVVVERIVELNSAVRVIRLAAHYSGDLGDDEPGDGGCGRLKLRERIARVAREVRRQRGRSDDQLSPHSELEGMVGRSPVMREIFTRIRRIAPYYGTVLITGEAGTGKGLAARALHRLSPVANGPFVALDWTHFPENASDALLKSELFENGGTLFLDGIGDMPVTAQVKLLRILRDRQMRRHGSRMAQKQDMRLVAATIQEPGDLVAQQGFPEDLYRRLSMVEIHLPRLADRKEDLPLLARHFVARFAAKYGKEISGLTHAAHIRLSRYGWPGNVRELEDVIGYAAAAAEGGMIDFQDLPAMLQVASELGAGVQRKFSPEQTTATERTV